MVTFSRLLCGLAAAAGAVLVVPVAANATNNRPQVVVPDRPSPGPRPGGFSDYEGCYRVDGRIYGPYRLSFCLGSPRDSYYVVRGGGVYCEGSLDWSEGRRGVQINLARTSCGGGVAWSPDTMRCDFSGGRAEPPPPRDRFDNRPQVVVPDRPGGDRPIVSGELTCRYFPAARGFEEITIIARPN